MKWCIITTIGKNPGDEFIRIGVENIIREVDKNAEICLVDKETSDIFNNHNFDKCILAGMPVFWSFYDNNFWEIGWWKPIAEHYSADKNKFMIMGAGSFQNWKDPTIGLHHKKYNSEIKNISERSWKLILRDKVPNDLTGFNFDVLTCPAVFSTKKYKKTSDIKLCNLMPHGSHYANYDLSEYQQWTSKVKQLTPVLQNAGFTFIAHSSTEAAFAQQVGWKDIITYNGDPGSLLPHYKNCVKYFGNRVHGCIVAKGVNADVLSCGYDSRQEAVKHSGATCLLPSQIDITQIEKWVDRDLDQPIFEFEKEFEQQKNIVNEFKNI